MFSDIPRLKTMPLCSPFKASKFCLQKLSFPTWLSTTISCIKSSAPGSVRCVKRRMHHIANHGPQHRIAAVRSFVDVGQKARLVTEKSNEEAYGSLWTYVSGWCCRSLGRGSCHPTKGWPWNLSTTVTLDVGTHPMVLTSINGPSQDMVTAGHHVVAPTEIVHNSLYLSTWGLLKPGRNASDNLWYVSTSKPRNYGKRMAAHSTKNRCNDQD